MLNLIALYVFKRTTFPFLCFGVLSLETLEEKNFSDGLKV